MKYFTPELLERFGSEDDIIADAALEEWETVSQKYRDHLQEIKGFFPHKLKGLLRRFNFHDAKVCFVGEDQQTLHLSVRLDTPPRSMVFLRYGLVEEVKFTHHTVLPEEKCADLYWLYDEFDLISDGPFPVFQHSILFTGGLELTIVFQTFTFAKAQALAANGGNREVHDSQTFCPRPGG